MLRATFVSFLTLSLLTGLMYPALVTGIAQGVFPEQANASLIVQNGRVVGSRLIGQSFSEAKYFWSRPSATAPMAYNAAASSGSNLGPSNPALLEAVKGRLAQLQGSGKQVVPIDLVTTSASGLDPHITPAAALFQADRVAAARRVEPAVIRALVERKTEGRLLGIFGEPRVNVLLLNLELDALERQTPRS